MYRLFRAPRGLRGKLFKLTGPIFLETLLMLTLGVVDTLMLSHHSDNALASGECGERKVGPKEIISNPGIIAPIIPHSKPA